MSVFWMNSSLIEKECAVDHEEILTFLDDWDHVELKRQRISVRQDYCIEIANVYYDTFFFLVVYVFSDDEDRVTEKSEFLWCIWDVSFLVNRRMFCRRAFCLSISVNKLWSFQKCDFFSQILMKCAFIDFEIIWRILRFFINRNNCSRWLWRLRRLWISSYELWLHLNVLRSRL
jgi:hypothetical protein